MCVPTFSGTKSPFPIYLHGLVLNEANEQLYLQFRGLVIILSFLLHHHFTDLPINDINNAKKITIVSSCWMILSHFSVRPGAL